jgi:HK97 family phage major capsid protein
MKDKIEKMRVSILKAVNEARSVLDASTDGKLSAESQAKYDAIIADVKADQGNVERMERQMALEVELRKSAGVETADGKEVKPATDAELRAFGRYLATGKPSAELRSLQSDSPEDGGYINAPQVMVSRLIQKLDDMMFIRRFATVIPVSSSDSLGCPTLEENPDDADWTAEVGDVSEDASMKFGKRELKPHLLSKEIKVSMKLLRVAALPVENLIMDRMAYKFALPEEKAFLTGNGAGQPLGLFTASADGISTGRDYSTGNSATAIAFDNLIGNKYNVKEQYQANAKWLFSREAVGNIAKLKDGEGRYIWIVSPVAGQPDTLLGKPVFMSEWVPHVFTASKYVGLYGDLSQYWIADGTNFSVQRLSELNARNNKIGFIGRKETDGMPVLEEAFSRVKLSA